MFPRWYGSLRTTTWLTIPRARVRTDTKTKNHDNVAKYFIHMLPLLKHTKQNTCHWAHRPQDTTLKEHHLHIKKWHNKQRMFCKAATHDKEFLPPTAHHMYKRCEQNSERKQCTYQSRNVFCATQHTQHGRTMADRRQPRQTVMFSIRAATPRTNHTLHTKKPLAMASRPCSHIENAETIVATCFGQMCWKQLRFNRNTCRNFKVHLQQAAKYRSKVQNHPAYLIRTKH